MIFLPVIVVLAACWHSFLALHQLWTAWADTSYTHGYLIAAICLWLLWRERKACAAVATPVTWRRLGPLAIVMWCWLFAVMAGIETVEFLLLLPLFWCAIGASLGWAAARRATFAVCYFVFSLPAWGEINGIFQWSTVYAVRAVLRVVGVPAFFEANRVQIPEGTFEVAGGCSGLHFVVVAAALAALLGELRRDGLGRRIKLLLLAVGLAMLANWVRVFIIIMAGHVTHMQNYLVARSHYGFGWVVFSAVMALFFWLESRLPESKHATSPLAASIPQPVGARHWSRMVLALVPVLALFAIWHALAVRPATGELEKSSPRRGWNISGGASDNWKPILAGVDESDQLLYRRDDGAAIDAYVGLYRWQSQGKEFSAYWNDLDPGATFVEGDTRVIAGSPLAIQRFHSAGGDDYLVAATYRVGQKTFAQPELAQLWYALSALGQLRSPVSQVLLLRTVCRPDCAAALDLLRDWKDAS